MRTSVPDHGGDLKETRIVLEVENVKDHGFGVHRWSISQITTKKYVWKGEVVMKPR